MISVSYHVGLFEVKVYEVGRMGRWDWLVYLNNDINDTFSVVASGASYISSKDAYKMAYMRIRHFIHMDGLELD